MHVGQNGRHLVTEDGAPFFYLADTAWNLLFSVDEEERRWYVRRRAEQGFTVIMTSCVREGGIEAVRTVEGLRPFTDGEPRDLSEPFWATVDSLLSDAHDLGLTVALLPTWGEYVHPAWGAGPVVFTEESARSYGRFLGTRYRDRPNLIWVNGGDRDPQTPEVRAVFTALARGLREGDGGKHPITYHPMGGSDSATFFHNEPWLDFNMMQSGKRWDMPNYEYIRRDYERAPAKPVVEGEAQYENSHEYFSRRPPTGARITAHQVRKSAYNAVLSGAMGHTYGCRDVFFFHQPETTPSRKDMDTHWKQALEFPGAAQMGHLRRAMEENQWHLLDPDFEGKVVRDGCGSNGTFTPAAYSTEAGVALVYFPERMALRIDTALVGTATTAEWFDPVNGSYAPAEPVGENGDVFEPGPFGPDSLLVLREEDRPSG